MSTTQSGVGVATRFEVTVIPVSDVDRAKDFYVNLGWRLDADFPIDEHYRIVQFTPTGSPASVQFGTGTSDAPAGSARGLYLIVDDIEAARDELIGRGVAVNEIWHGRGLGTDGHLPGRDPQGTSYGSFASFADPDGNVWLLQEITQRLPGRSDAGGVQAVADLLLETSLHHDAFEKAAPMHDWWDWYAAYFVARQAGSNTDGAITEANRYMAEVKHIIPAE